MKINKRHLPILIAIAAVVIGIVVFTPKAPSDNNVTTGGMSTPPVTLPATEGKPANFQPPQSLEEARTRAKARLEALEKMSEAEWQAEQAEKTRRREEQMARFRAMMQQREQPEEPAAGGVQRLPDLEPKKAEPPSPNF